MQSAPQRWGRFLIKINLNTSIIIKIGKGKYSSKKNGEFKSERTTMVVVWSFSCSQAESTSAPALITQAVKH
jgi:hypothetical protein